MSDNPAGGNTILLTGPPAAGKTATALLWSVQRPQRAFAIDWDHICSTLAIGDQLSGRTSPGINERYAFAAKVAVAQADYINRSGVDCVIVGARPPFPAPEYEQTWADLDALDPITVVLLPRPDVCVARNAAEVSRKGDFAVPTEWILSSFANYEWERWAERPRSAVIDTSDMTQAEVVDELERRVLELSGSA